MQVITDWFRRHFSNPQVVFLALFLILLFAVIIVMGNMLAPIIAGVIVAYLLEGIVRVLQRAKLPRLLAVLIVFCAFFVFVILILFGLLPLLSKQATQLFQQIPAIISESQKVLMQLPERYPDVISAAQVQEAIIAIRFELAQLGQRVLSLSMASVVGVITLLVYAILFPILVFFFLKDKQQIIDWFTGYLPREHHLAAQVWTDVDRQIGNYIRGKFWEILAVGSASFATFSFFRMEYAMLLGVLVGLSVLIPFVGAAVVTIPVVVIAWFQWGWGSDFAWLICAYLVIQALDGNLLVPLLFSEVVNLHPVAIILAVLFFGGLWGVWGVFFAIPLATLVQAVLTAWPKAALSAPSQEAAIRQP